MMLEAENQLRNFQRQLDADGIMVGVSRQAIDEVLVELDHLRTAVARYCDRSRMGTVEPSEVQQAIDRAFEFTPTK